MKRKSMIINLNGLAKKFVYTVSVISVTAVSVHLGIPEYVMDKLAGAVFASDDNTAEITGLFSLEGENVLQNMMLYKPDNSKKTVKPQTAAPTKSKTDAPEITEVVPDTHAVDISHDKGANAVEENNIIVSNAPKKQFNITELLNRPLEYTQTDGYKVLIIHTHTTESYLPNDRSENQAENIVRVGDEFTNVLTQNGIKTLHCKTVHDAPYSKSYINEAASLKQILAENPSIEVVIDVHRDGLYNSKNEKLRPVTEINGESTAQVMLVCGTDASGLPHETWQSCFAFAIKVQNNMNKNYPNLARPINLRTERFNTNMTKNSVIFEIGANGNTLSEAVNAAKYAAQSIADVLNKKN